MSINNPRDTSTSSTIKQLEDLIETDGIVSFDPICVRNKSNISTNTNEYNFDADNFNPVQLNSELSIISPKLHTLIDKIKELDKTDYKTHGKLFKHVIYSEFKTASNGARLITSALIANNMNLGYSATMKSSYNPNATNNINATQDDNVKMQSKKRYNKMSLLTDAELLQNKNKNMYLLSSSSVYDQSINVKYKTEMLQRFNKRPENIHGELVRIMILDSGYKEGIDLFDVKYIHIFEPTVNESMQKQIIGRGTRICGQRGLDFHPIHGWKLHVFVYDLVIPKLLQSSFIGATSAIDLYLKSMNINMEYVQFESDLEQITIDGAVDYDLNVNIHKIKPSKIELISDNAIISTNSDVRKPYWEMRRYIQEYYGEYKWDIIKMKNLCNENASNNASNSRLIKYNQTQEFIRHYFTSNNPCKGMLLWHSVGTGKTCSAIANATTQFEKQEYTILWVTRASLKTDIWKNMFDQVCNESIRAQIELNDLKIPDTQSKRMKLLSKSWKIRPMSYKQLSNLVSKNNSYYNELVRKNGIDDPLRKTLIIIDEAHKLYNNADLSSLERPDTNALYEAISKSYEISGKDSVRLLLMTATPIIDSPFDVIKLVNLCKPISERIPDEYEQFAHKYLTNGKFTKTTKLDYLNDISGYISYLNRTTDARQFAQPEITYVNIPIVNDDGKSARQFDKKIANELLNPTISNLRNQIVEHSKLLELETADLDKNRFNFLKKEICNEHSSMPKKICDKVVNANVKLLVNELKDKTKVVRDNIKEIRTNLNEHIETRRNHMSNVGNNVKEFKDDYKQYEKSILYQLKRKCGIKIDNNINLKDKIKTHPPIIELDNKLKCYNDQIHNINNTMQLQINNGKSKIKQMQTMIQTHDLNALEKSVVRMNIKSTRKEHSNKTRETRKLNKPILKDIHMQIQDASKRRHKLYKSIHSTIKKRLHTEKQKAKENVRETKRLRKILRKQHDYKEQINDETVKALVSKYKIKINDDLDGLDNEMLEKEREKERIRLLRIEEREAKQIIAEQKRYDKHVERETKRILKEREKIALKRDKEREKLELKRAKVNKTESKKPKKILLRKTIKINMNKT